MPRPFPSALLRAVVLIAAVAGGAGCSGPARTASQGELEARIARNPRDGESLRELGALLARSGQPAPARDALELAVAIRPDDGKALYLLGLATEASGNPAAAEPIYARYTQIPTTDVYRDSLSGRLGTIVRTRLRSEFAAALAADDTLATVGGTNAIGVLPFAYRGGDEQYAALGRGLAEVLSADLASIGGLTVVERVRLEALLAEYELARRGLLDPTTAPRAGGLLRAERLVGGEYGVSGSDLRIDAAVWEASQDSISVEAAEGGIADLFRVQRQMTNTVLTALGIAVSPEDQARLSTAPTDDLVAFLLFSRGLLEEDRGNFERASALYGEALAQDPGFSLAAGRRAEADLSAKVSGPAGAVLFGAATPALQPGIDLVALRASALGASLQANLGPSEDSREPVVEGNQSGILGPLPDPPPPPPSTGGN